LNAVPLARNRSPQPLPLIAIDGIWGLAFGNGVSLDTPIRCTSPLAPNLEQDGIFGRLRFAPQTKK